MKQSLTFYIVTPSYMQAAFIKQSVESVLAQSIKTTLLVMDGGSSDGTVEILKEYDKQIIWQSKKDKGQSDALNQGLRKVLAQITETDQESVIFAYLNSDDYYLPDAFEKVAAYFAANPEASWVVGECQIVNEQGQPIQSLIQLYKALWRKVLSWPVLLILNPIPQPAVFIRVSAVARVGEFNQDLRYTMDYEYWLRLWQKVGPPGILDQSLSAFRIHSQSKGTQSFHQQFAEQLTVAQSFTKNRAWLLLQSVHNKLITFFYSFMK